MCFSYWVCFGNISENLHLCKRLPLIMFSFYIFVLHFVLLQQWQHDSGNPMNKYKAEDPATDIPWAPEIAIFVLWVLDSQHLCVIELWQPNKLAIGWKNCGTFRKSGLCTSSLCCSSWLTVGAYKTLGHVPPLLKDATISERVILTQRKLIAKYYNKTKVYKMHWCILLTLKKSLKVVVSYDWRIIF